MSKQKGLSGVLFLTVVLLLFLNDFILKYKFHNEITGKLSDFAGLFAFPYFISLFVPKQAKAVYFLTAFLFIIWKSPFIQPVITLFNNIGIGISRVEDYTDLISLLILPFSYKYLISPNKILLRLPNIFKPVITGFCCFCFVATSVPREEGNTHLTSNLKVILQATPEQAEYKMDLRASKNGTYECELVFEEINANITSYVTLKSLPGGLLEIKLDSIGKYNLKGNMFTGIDENDVKALKEFSVKEYEKVFLETKVMRMYKN